MTAATYRGRTMTFCQNFNGTALDPILRTAFGWSGGTGRTLSGNSEAEYYCDPATPAAQGGTPNINPFQFTGNSLIITAAPSTDLSNATGTRNLPYSSGMVSTWNTWSQVFGRWEMRARFTKSGTGRGFWPAFWMLPKDITWPPEIDVCELFLGTNIAGEGGPTKVHTGLVAGQPGAKTSGVGTQWNTLPAGASYEDGAFHLFWFEWDSNGMTWGFDGVTLNTTRTPSQFVKPMYVIANLAVGLTGAWPTAPEPGATATMEIDHIRCFSDFPDAVPVAWPGCFSADGVDTTPVGAISATGPIKIGTGSVTLTVASHILPAPTSLSPATFNLLVDGAVVAPGLLAPANYDAGQWTTVTVPNVAIDGAARVGVQFTDAFFAKGSNGNPDWNRILEIKQITLSDPANNIAETLTGSNLMQPVAAGVAINADGSVRMGSNGIATFIV